MKITISVEVNDGVCGETDKFTKLVGRCPFLSVHEFEGIGLGFDDYDCKLFNEDLEYSKRTVVPCLKCQKAKGWRHKTRLNK